MLIEGIKRRGRYLGLLAKDDPWLKVIGIAYGLLGFFILVRDEFWRPADPANWALVRFLPLNIFQWLLAGLFLALLWVFEASLRTTSALNEKLKQCNAPRTAEEERKFKAARALLPSNLDAVMEYAVASIRWLKSVREKAGLLDQGQYKTAVSVATAPRPDAVIDRLRDGVENLDDAASDYIGEILRKIQVQRSRVKWLEDYFATHMDQRSSRIGLVREVDQYTANSIEIAALARQLFSYARGESDNPPGPLDLVFLESTLRECGLDVHQDVNSWNILSTPYLGKPSPYHYIEPVPDGDLDRELF